jgi:hypothetical protein
MLQRDRVYAAASDRVYAAAKERGSNVLAPAAVVWKDDVAYDPAIDSACELQMRLHHAMKASVSPALCRFHFSTP